MRVCVSVRTPYILCNVWLWLILIYYRCQWICWGNLNFVCKCHKTSARPIFMFQPNLVSIPRFNIVNLERIQNSIFMGRCKSSWHLWAVGGKNSILFWLYSNLIEKQFVKWNQNVYPLLSYRIWKFEKQRKNDIETCNDYACGFTCAVRVKKRDYQRNKKNKKKSWLKIKHTKNRDSPSNPLTFIQFVFVSLPFFFLFFFIHAKQKQCCDCSCLNQKQKKN